MQMISCKNIYDSIDHKPKGFKDVAFMFLACDGVFVSMCVCNVVKVFK